MLDGVGPPTLRSRLAVECLVGEREPAVGQLHQQVTAAAALQPGQRRPRRDWHLPTEPSPPSPTAAATSDAPDPVAGARGYGPAPVAELSPRPVTDTGTSVLASSLSSDSAEEAPAAA